ncbi:MAG: PilZ domain-containing protein [Tepidiformaceae bacterium]
MAQGLMPGITIRLDVSSGGEGETHVTRVEGVEENIAILVPMRGLRPRPFTAGTLVHAHYVHQQKRWMFVTEVEGHSSDGMFEYLRLPAAIESTERRRNFRLPAAIRPESIYRIVVDAETEEPELLEGTVVDLSEGGCCISTRSFAMPGERLGLNALLPEAGDIQARMRINTVRDPERGNRNRRLHCEFTDISRAHRDVIARYMMRRQLEMRRRGQL